MTKHVPEPENENGKKPGWWQRFRSMPDAQRAEILAKILVWTIIALLYLLGGASLYLRARYLPAIPSQTTITNTPTQEPTVPTPTKTLYPSRTPKSDSTGDRNITAAWAVSIGDGAAVDTNS